jgi:hypothetical protein
VLDVKHSEDWNREALRPLVEGDPARAHAIAEGALIRLRCGAALLRALSGELWADSLARAGTGRPRGDQLSLGAFDAHRDAHAAADAQVARPLLAPSAAHLVEAASSARARRWRRSDGRARSPRH